MHGKTCSLSQILHGENLLYFRGAKKGSKTSSFHSAKINQTLIARPSPAHRPLVTRSLPARHTLVVRSSHARCPLVTRSLSARHTLFVCSSHARCPLVTRSLSACHMFVGFLLKLMYRRPILQSWASYGRILKRFRYDEHGVPRVWKPDDDVNGVFRKDQVG